MILTGDLHANVTRELDYLNPIYLRSKYGSKCENTLIFVLGDGGFLWHNDKYSDFHGELINTLESWLYDLNSQLIVIPGNHENYQRIYSKECPLIQLNEYNIKGQFREISTYIKYTERFGEYTFEDKSVLILGGALSLDRFMRHEGEWFQEETFSIEEKNLIISLIKDSKYDYVFAHTCPNYILKQIYGNNIFRDANSEFFDRIMNYITPEVWYFGHLHPMIIDNEYNFGNFKNLEINSTKFKCLFKDIQDVI